MQPVTRCIVDVHNTHVADLHVGVDLDGLLLVGVHDGGQPGTLYADIRLHAPRRIFPGWNADEVTIGRRRIGDSIDGGLHRFTGKQRDNAGCLCRTGHARHGPGTQYVLGLLQELTTIDNVHGLPPCGCPFTVESKAAVQYGCDTFGMLPHVGHGTGRGNTAMNAEPG